ncbi:MAG: hypothetical protein K2L12_03005 [Clostridia bacterium]|nr:hypothetical protein [Clostridia bacterium]
MRYVKTVVAIILFELMIGKIGYEYGCGNRINDIGWLYGYTVYSMIYIAICIYQGWNEVSLRKNIFSVTYIFLPYAILLILAFVSGIVEDELPFAVSMFVILGIALILEVSTLIVQIKKKIADRNSSIKTN